MITLSQVQAVAIQAVAVQAVAVQAVACLQAQVVIRINSLYESVTKLS